MGRTICEDVVVLTFGSGMAVDLAAMILADNGARVLKVEPQDGDRLRKDLPSGFLTWNRGKESVVLDLNTEAGHAKALELAKHADILVDGFNTGIADNLGIGYEAVHKQNPALVYCSIKGFGSKGPYAHIKADQGLVAAKSGAFLHAGFRPGPMYHASPNMTYGAGHMALQGILAALVVREKTGRGQFVEATLYQGNSPYDHYGMTTYQMYQRDPVKYPTKERGSSTIASTFCTKDNRWITWNVMLPHQQMAVVQAIGFDWIFEDARYADYPHIADPNDAQEFFDLVIARIRGKTLREWLEIFLADNDIPFEVLVTTEEALDHPQVIHNGQRVEIDDPVVSKMLQVGPNAWFSDTPVRIGKPAPLLGQHAKLPLRNGHLPRPTGQTAPAHPLDGVKIVECAYFMATPGGVSLVTAYGARVFKIEPLEGDPMRWAYNFPDAGGDRTMQGKESLPVDLKSPEGQKIVHQLVADSDVFITSFRPGVPEKMRLDYETLRKINPRLVYIHVPGYGTSGPYHRRPMYAGTVTASAGGYMRQAAHWLNPEHVKGLDVPGLRALVPRIKSLVDGDANGALALGTILMLAIYDQRRTGKGQLILSTQTNGNIWAYSDDFNRYEGKKPIVVPDPDYYGLNALDRLYQAQSGWVFLSVTDEDEWRNFCSETGLESLLRDPRYATAEARRTHDADLVVTLSSLFAERSAEAWEHELAPKGVGLAKVFESARKEGPPLAWDANVNDYSEFTCTDRVIRETGLVAEVDNPIFGPMLRHGLPVQLSETPGIARTGAKLGQHTDSILKELGYSPSKIARLKEKRVVAGVSPV